MARRCCFCEFCVYSGRICLKIKFLVSINIQGLKHFARKARTCCHSAPAFVVKFCGDIKTNKSFDSPHSLNHQHIITGITSSIKICAVVFLWNRVRFNTASLGFLLGDSTQANKKFSRIFPSHKKQRKMNRLTIQNIGSYHSQPACCLFRRKGKRKVASDRKFCKWNSTIRNELPLRSIKQSRNVVSFMSHRFNSINPFGDRGPVKAPAGWTQN